MLVNRCERECEDVSGRGGGTRRRGERGDECQRGCVLHTAHVIYIFHITTRNARTAPEEAMEV